MARDIYLAILRAAKKGRGVHLNEKEVEQLAQDDAILQGAIQCVTECGCDVTGGSCEYCYTQRVFG